MDVCVGGTCRGPHTNCTVLGHGAEHPALRSICNLITQGAPSNWSFSCRRTIPWRHQRWRMCMDMYLSHEWMIGRNGRLEVEEASCIYPTKGKLITLQKK